MALPRRRRDLMRRRRCAYRTDCSVRNRILAGAARAKRSASIREVGSGREGPRGLPTRLWFEILRSAYRHQASTPCSLNPAYRCPGSAAQSALPPQVCPTRGPSRTLKKGRRSAFDIAPASFDLVDGEWRAVWAFCRPSPWCREGPQPRRGARAPASTVRHATSGSASSFGRRMRLQAAAEKAKTMSTRSRPRIRMRRKSPNSLPHPKPSSIRLRMRWLSA